MGDIYAEIDRKQAELEDVLSDAPKGPGVVVGRIFKRQVMDGYAFYRITKVRAGTTGTVTYEWLALGFDPYKDVMLGEGGTLPLEAVERIFSHEDRINSLFGIAQ